MTIELTIEGQMRRTLAELELLSHGKVTSYDPSGHGTADSREPSGESAPPHLEFAARWAECPDEGTLAAAREYLGAWKKRMAPLPDTDLPSLEEMVIEQGEGYAVAQVASRFGIAETRVRRIRLKLDRESEFGLPTQFAQHRESEVETGARIRNLADRGCTERQIALQVGVGKSTVRRALGRAA